MGVMMVMKHRVISRARPPRASWPYMAGTCSSLSAHDIFIWRCAFFARAVFQSVARRTCGMQLQDLETRQSKMELVKLVGSLVVKALCYKPEGRGLENW
jgi:hypothetical protein